MKRILTNLLVLAISISLVLPAGAVRAAAAEPIYASTSTEVGGNRPELIITEIVTDTEKNDSHEYIEIRNVSTREINLYDYSLAYNPAPPYLVTELKPGDIGITAPRGIINPDTMILAPGECVVVWLYTSDSANATQPHGVMSFETFRAYWADTNPNDGLDYGLDPADKVIAMDAVKSDNSERFNIANSGNRAVHIVRDQYNETPVPDLVVCTAPWDTGTALGTPVLNGNDGMEFRLDLASANVKRMVSPAAYNRPATPGYVKTEQIPVYTIGTQPPVVRHTALPSAVAPADTVISADITFDETVNTNAAYKSATLYYRFDEAGPYTGVPMAASGGTYSYTIPQTSFLGKSSLSYSIVARDLDYSVTTAECRSDILDTSNVKLAELWAGDMPIGIGNVDYITGGNESYTVKTTALQTVTARAESANANVSVVQATEANKTATVTVTSTDGMATKTYTVAFDIVAKKGPDILITEAMPNAVSVAVPGALDDDSEFFELYNNGTYPVNLYDYGMGYKANAADSYKVTVPKAGNAGVGSEINPDSNPPLNPDKSQAILKPGETAVIWVYWTAAITNHATREQFINKYNRSLSPSKIFIIDGRTATQFNLPNKGPGYIAVLTRSPDSAAYNREVCAALYPAKYENNAIVNWPDGTALFFEEDDACTVYPDFMGSSTTPTPGVIDPSLQLINYADETPPVITHDPAADVLTTEQGIRVSADITDELLLKPHRTMLYYKTKEAIDYTALSGSQTGEVFSATIPIAAVNNTMQVQYYFTACDGLHVVNSDTFSIQLPDPSVVTLSSLKYNGSTENIPGFSPSKTAYEVALTGDGNPADDLAFTTTNPTARAAASAYNAETGNVNVTVTSANGLYTKIYTIHFYTGLSANTKLASLTADGKPVRAFDSGIKTFRVQYTGALPTVAATADNSGATVTITQATEANKTAAILVTAANGASSDTYTINFVPAVTPPDYPELVITEIMPNTKGNDWYEYLEVYNTSDRALNLGDYKLMYYSNPSDPTIAVRANDITQDLMIAPHDTVVLWIRWGSSAETFAQFQAHHGTSLDNAHLIEIPGYEAPNFNLANSGTRLIAICKDNAALRFTSQEGLEADDNVTSYIVYGENTEYSDVGDGLAINFKPVDGVKKMNEYQWCVDPTVGYQHPEQMVLDYDDPAPPVVTDQTIVEGGTLNLTDPAASLTIRAYAWDESELRTVKFCYKTESLAVEQTVEPVSAGNGVYTYTIPRSQLEGLTGLDYRIEAADGLSTVSYPAEGYVHVNILDSFGPSVSALKPMELYYFVDQAQPTISAFFSDYSGIEAGSVALSFGLKDAAAAVTGGITVTANSVSYPVPTALGAGVYEAILSVSDTKGNNTTKSWTFEVGREKYNLYAGMIHSHSAESDGQGTPAEAYSWAKNTSKLDFFGLTDHAHLITKAMFDNQKQLAATYDEPGKFVTMPGFEMTWNASVGWWGHMNVFQTDWIETLLTTNQNLGYFYDRLANSTGALGQFNHPGDNWGNFGNYAYRTDAADNAVDLIEIKAPEHEQDYIKALDAGWHVTPVHDDDTHTKNWGSDGAGGVILAPSLTLDNLLEAIRAHRTYSTDDTDIAIRYYGNGEIMGSQLKNIDSLTLRVQIDYADANVGTVEIVTDTGLVYASTNVAAKTLDWTLDNVPVTNRYYYVRVKTANGMDCETAPIWVENNNALIVEKTLVGNHTADAANPYEVAMKLGNTADSAMTGITAQVYRDNQPSGDPIAIGDIAAGGTSVVSILLAYDAASRDVVISLSGTADGKLAGKLVNVVLPELLITEIVTRNSATTVKSDPFQYIELYNASGRALNLKNYNFTWWIQCNSNQRWDIAGDFTIAPYSTALVWVKYEGDSAATAATLADFNAHYGTSFTESQVLTLTVQSTMNSSTGHKIYLSADAAAAGENAIQQCIEYNTEYEIGKENIPNQSIQFAYDSSRGTYEQVKLGADLPPTPGAVAANQVPYTGSADEAFGIKHEQAALTLAGVSDKTYGDAAFTVSVTGGSGTGAVTFASSNPSVAAVNAETGEVTIAGAGETTFTATKAEDAAYFEAKATAVLRVAKKAVTVTADALNKAPGTSDPTLTYTVSPAIDGLAPLAGALARAAGEAAGTYPITQGTLTEENNPNYAITFVGADFTISTAAQAPLVLNGIAAKTYGDAPFTVTVSGGSGAGAVTYASSNPQVAAVDAATGTVTILGAGETTISAEKASDGTYLAAVISVTLNVNRLAVTVTANSVTKRKKTPDPALTYTVAPSVGSLAPLTGSLCRESGEKKDTYDILQGTLTDANNPNYSITYVGAVFKIVNNWNGGDKDSEDEEDDEDDEDSEDEEDSEDTDHGNGNGNDHGNGHEENGNENDHGNGNGNH